MISRISFVVILFCIISTAHSAVAPFIIKCKWDDAQCIKTTAQNAIPIFTNGIPELGVEKLEPLFMKNLDASSNGLNLYLKDIYGKGLKDCVAKKVLRERNGDNSKIIIKLQCNVDFRGQYQMDGVLLVLPIQGKGDARVVLRKIIIMVEADIGNTIGSDGEMHWNIKDWKYSYDLKDKSTIELENLFNGNEILGRAARELIASSSNEIIKEVGPPIIKAVISKIVNNVKAFFANVPASELAFD